MAPTFFRVDSWSWARHKKWVPRRALITGITGQVGSYLAELLLAKGYEVHGLVRRSSTFNTGRIDHVRDRILLHYGDLVDSVSLHSVVRKVQPDEVYNLAAQSHVRVSFEMPEYTCDVTGAGVGRLLEAIRGEAGERRIRFYQASSSEIFGNAKEFPQSETTPMHPRSPYAAAKAFGFHLTKNYREAFGMFACNGISFNCESPRRGENFVTRKITRAVGRIFCGLQDKVMLGNLDAQRDWGFAGDYVEAMWRMMQRATPDDFIIATGRTRSVRDFLGAAFGRVGLRWEDHVEVDPRQIRPAEVDVLQGDASKARKMLEWEPVTSFEALVAMMVDADLELARRERDGRG